MLQTPKRFIHGFLGSSKDWQTLGIAKDECIDLWSYIENLEENAFATICERIDKDMPDTFELYAYSFGARLALYYTIKNPHKVNKLTLFSVNPGIEDEATKQARIKKDKYWAKQLEEQTADNFLKEWNQQEVFQYDKNIENLPCDKRLLVQSLHKLGLGVQENLWPRLNELTMPTYFLAGEYDKKFAAIVNRIDNHTNHICHILPKQGHRIPFSLDLNAFKQVPWMWI